MLQGVTRGIQKCRSFVVSVGPLSSILWLNTVLAACEYLSLVKSWQEKGCSA